MSEQASGGVEVIPLELGPMMDMPSVTVIEPDDPHLLELEAPVDVANRYLSAVRVPVEATWALPLSGLQRGTVPARWPPGHCPGWDLQQSLGEGKSIISTYGYQDWLREEIQRANAQAPSQHSDL